MLKVIQNILSWPIFRILKREESLTPEEEEEYIKVPEEVAHDFTKEERESCPWLDLGDRAAVLFGKPALDVYLEIQQFNTYLKGSIEDDASDIFSAEYVNKGIVMAQEACRDLGLEVPPAPEMPPISRIPGELTPWYPIASAPTVTKTPWYGLL